MLIRRIDGRTPNAHYLVSTASNPDRMRAACSNRNDISCNANRQKKDRAWRNHLQRQLDEAKRDYAVEAGERAAMVFAERGYSRPDITDKEIEIMARCYGVDVSIPALWTAMKGSVLANLYSMQRHVHRDVTYEFKPRSFSRMETNELLDLTPRAAGIRI